MRLLTVIQLNGDCEIFGETRIFKIQPVSALLSFSEIFQKPYDMFESSSTHIFTTRGCQISKFPQFLRKSFNKELKLE